MRRDAANRRPIVGVLMTSLVNLYQVQWLGAVDAAREYGVSLIAFVGRELDSPLGYDAHGNVIYDAVGPDAVDGLILWSTALQVYAGTQRLHGFVRRFESLPLVSVEQVLPGYPGLLLDNHGGMRAAVSHLIEDHGYRRIAFVRGPIDHLGAQERYEGYLQALAEHGIPTDPQLVSPHPRSWDPDEPAAWLGQLLAERPDLDAVAAVNDAVAGGILAALGERGVRVPDELGVTGFDDIVGGLAEIEPLYHDPGLGREDQGTEGGALERAVDPSASTIALTTVRAPFYELGWRAVEVMLAQLDGQHVPDVEVRPAELIVRRSCGCLAPLPNPEDSPAAALGDAADVLDELSAAFLAELAGAPGNPFLSILDEHLRASIRNQQRLEGWWEVLRQLRQRMSSVTSENPAAGEALWVRAQRLIENTADRLTLYQGLLVEKRNQLVREVGQRLVTTLDSTELAIALAEQLPNLAIPSCYLAMYAPESDASVGSCERSRALLVYEHGRAVELDPDSTLFPTKQLAPRSLFERANPVSLVALPLHFKKQQLGFVVFELGPRAGWIYEALQQQLSSALEAALLVEREREARRELHREIAHRADIEAALQQARDELETRVEARTAELARANDVLKQQILERRQAQAAQAQLEAELRQAQRAERERLAAELHDSVSQALFSMTLHTRALQLIVRQQGADSDGRVTRGLSDLHELTRVALAEMRELLLQMRPDTLHDEGLAQVIRRHAASVAGRTGIEVTVTAPRDRLPLPEDVEYELLRMVQEALHNGVKHANPTRMDIRLVEPTDMPGTLIVEVADDGSGFTPDIVRPGHMGLETMRQRVQRVGGQLIIDSSPTSPTVVRAILPDALRKA